MHRLIIDEDLITIVSNNAGKTWRVMAEVSHEKNNVTYELVWDDVPDEAVGKITSRKLIAFLKEHKPDAIGTLNRTNLISISEIELIERAH